MQRRQALVALAAAGTAGLPRAPRAQAAAAPLHLRRTGDLGALASIEASLHGRPFRALLDTGASTALVGPALAGALGLRVLGRSRVSAVGGEAHVDRVQTDSVQVADARLPMPTALVLDLEAQLGPAAAGWDGLIGMPALREQVSTFDFLHRRFALAAPIAPDARTLPVRWESGLPVIDLRLGDRAPAPFLLDTGNAGALVVFARHAEGLLATTASLPSLTVREIGGEVSAAYALLERLDAVAWQARDVPVAFETGSRARRGGRFDRLAGSLGLALFLDGRITLDAPGSRVEMAWPDGADRPPLPGGFGFALGPGPGSGLRVTAVLDGSPAARAGVRPGARLRSLDGQPATDLMPHDVWQRLHGMAAADFEWSADAAGALRTRLARERFFPPLR